MGGGGFWPRPYKHPFQSGVPLLTMLTSEDTEKHDGTVSLRVVASLM